MSDAQRNLALALAVTAALTSFAAQGCGSDGCVGVCEDVQDCGSGSEVDCEAECAKDAKVAEASGCTAQNDAIYTCLESQDDVCLGALSCLNTAFELSACVQSYCSAHPEDTATCAND